MNSVTLVGRLTKKPELRQTPQGVSVATFTIAVNRKFANQAGEREADFINVVIWRKPAENVSQYTDKGSLVGVEGSIRTRSYDAQDGTRRYVTEVVAESVTFLESRNSNKNNNETYQQKSPTQNNSNTTQNGNQAAGQKPVQEEPTFLDSFDLTDDDLPF
jgi:single-strand DNA-binding protein